jgi:hypothetical protein
MPMDVFIQAKTSNSVLIYLKVEIETLLNATQFK